MVHANIDEQDRQKFLSQTVRGAINASLGAAAVAGVASFGLQKYGVKAYTRLTPALKVFGVVAAGTAGFVVGADSEARKFELAKYKIGAGTKLEKIAHEGETLEQRLGISDVKSRVSHENMSTKDIVVAWSREHKYGTVFAAWLASLAGALGYISLTPLTFGQKVVQARMVAQGLTVGVVIVSGLVTSLPTTGGVDEDKIKRERREEALYKWKKGTQHDREHHEGDASKSSDGTSLSAGDDKLVLPGMNSKH